MERVLTSVLRRLIRVGSVEVRLPSGALCVLGDRGESTPRLAFGPNLSIRKLLLRPSLTFGEGVMDGAIRMERGSIYDVLDLLNRNLNPPPREFAFLTRLSQMLRPYRRNTRKRSRDNVSFHYDIDRRLYRLFLDDDLQYSCAYFEDDDYSLEDAQLAKKRHIASKLCLKPNNTVLDIGSGWGGLAIYLASQCGANVTGITLSDEQLDVSRSRVLKEQLDQSVSFRLQDYREISGTFDRIVSVGMFEHVGPGHYKEYFECAANLLADDGVMLLHTIGRSDMPCQIDPFLEKYIFPGSYIPSLSEVLPEIEKNGLVVTDIEILRLHYAQTLAAWRDRFMKRRDEALKLYDERFCRMWEYYLAACEAGFRHAGLVVFQIQIARDQKAVPLTRNYISATEAKLRSAEFEKECPQLTQAAK